MMTMKKPVSFRNGPPNTNRNTNRVQGPNRVTTLRDFIQPQNGHEEFHPDVVQHHVQTDQSSDRTSHQKTKKLNSETNLVANQNNSLKQESGAQYLNGQLNDPRWSENGQLNDPQSKNEQVNENGQMFQESKILINNGPLHVDVPPVHPYLSPVPTGYMTYLPQMMNAVSLSPHAPQPAGQMQQQHLLQTTAPHQFNNSVMVLPYANVPPPGYGYSAPPPSPMPLIHSMPTSPNMGAMSVYHPPPVIQPQINIGHIVQYPTSMPMHTYPTTGMPLPLQSYSEPTYPAIQDRGNTNALYAQQNDTSAIAAPRTPVRPRNPAPQSTLTRSPSPNDAHQVVTSKPHSPVNLTDCDCPREIIKVNGQFIACEVINDVTYFRPAPEPNECVPLSEVDITKPPPAIPPISAVKKSAPDMAPINKELLHRLNDDAHDTVNRSKIPDDAIISASVGVLEQNPKGTVGAAAPQNVHKSDAAGSSNGDGHRVAAQRPIGRNNRRRNKNKQKKN